ncbi:threonine/serine exporter family protein [Niallia sp. Krafla_26]|uniref:threonine/serine exporter family protein n=1 Tax=Niallia sp. Krafla_26 TaxID=3064703 RepID=UPI003D1805F4
MIIQQLITSFLASASFGVLFNVPKNRLIHGGLSGMIGWICYFLLVEKGTDSVVASLLASIIIGTIGQIFARFYKTPVIVFNVAGIIPLVPGGLAYDAMRHFVLNDYSTALQLAAKAFMISGGIAFGLVFSEVLKRVILQMKDVSISKHEKRYRYRD